MRSLFIVLLFSPFFLYGGEGIELRPSNLGEDRVQQGTLFSDDSREMELEEVMELEESRFRSIGRERENLGFTNSVHWLRFRVKNGMEEQERFLLEAARSITNRVTLYRVKDGRVVDRMRSGDHVPFSERPYRHRKSIFPVDLEPGEEAQFYLRLDSGGEILMLPLRFWDEEAFRYEDEEERSLLSFYYGALLFVVIIFAFFYFTLRERSFLYYVLYVASFAFLQFALDGFAYRYLFPSSPWLTDRAVVSGSSITVLLVLLYARDYLGIPQKSIKLDRVFRFFILLSVLSLLASLTSGVPHIAAHPFINGLSFIGTLFVLVTIFLLKRKGYPVSFWFLLAFLSLTGGVILFLIGNIGLVPPSHLTVHGLKIGSFGEVLFLSFTMAEKYRHLQQEKEQAKQDSLERLQELNRIKDDYNRELERTVSERTEELEEERRKLTETNQEIMSSIRYAQRIQDAILPPDRAIAPLFDDHFVLFKPRDIVSGDFYWFASVRKGQGDEGETRVSREVSSEFIPDRAELAVFAAVDCTGHGVPGAFLSIHGHDLLNRTLKEPSVNSPGEALNFLDRAIKKSFEHYSGEEGIRDGMDMGICAVDKERMRLQFAGANNPCYIVRDKAVHELKGDKMAIGGGASGEKGFTDHSFQLRKGDAIYLLSDGYPDQFGGPKGKKFKYKPFKHLLTEIQEKGMKDQKKLLDDQFEEWKGANEQVDDVLVIGVRIA